MSWRAAATALVPSKTAATMGALVM